MVGRYVLDGRIFDLLEQTQPGAGGEIQLTDAIAALLTEQDVPRLPLPGHALRLRHAHRPDRGDDPLRARPRETQRSRGAHDAEGARRAGRGRTRVVQGGSGGMPRRCCFAHRRCPDRDRADRRRARRLFRFDRGDPHDGAGRLASARSLVAVVDARDEHRRIVAGLAAVVARLVSVGDGQRLSHLVRRRLRLHGRARRRARNRRTAH